MSTHVLSSCFAVGTLVALAASAQSLASKAAAPTTPPATSPPRATAPSSTELSAKELATLDRDFHALVAKSKERQPPELENDTDGRPAWANSRLVFLHDQGLAFLEKYPTHPYRWDVLVLLQYGRDYRIRVLPDGFKQLVPVPESAERWELIYYPKLEELLAAWDASSEARKEAMQQLIRHWGHRATVVALAPEARASFSAKVMRWLEIYRREFPNSNYLSPLYHSVAVMLLSSDPRQALAFVRETSARHASGSLLDVLRRKRFAGLERLIEGHLQPVELFWTELQEIAPELGDRSRYRGKVVLISMTPVTWATHIPTLEKLYAEHSAAGLEIIQIAQYNTNSAAPPEQRDRAAMERFIAAKGWRWKVIWDPNGQDGIREKWGMNSYPAHFVIGRDGRIFNYRGGALDYIDDIPRALAQPTQ